MIGTLLEGRYRIEKLLGRGGMGAVYEGTQLDLSRRVAIKVLDVQVEADAIAATEREARAAAQLAHPHIVQVTDFSRGESGPPFIVMEYLQGESLAERIARTGPLAPEPAAFVAVQVLSALGAAHEAGLVHRDVKPANIFLARTAATHDFVKLLDFGVAWNMAPAASSRGLATAGTPAYMAPEQILGGTIDARTDIWAMGICLQEMLTGRRPFEAPRAAELLLKITDAPPVPLSVMAPSIDPELTRIVGRALEKKSERRFQSAEEMRAALAVIAGGAVVPSQALVGPGVVDPTGPRAPKTVPLALAPDAGATTSFAAVAPTTASSASRTLAAPPTALVEVSAPTTRSTSGPQTTRSPYPPAMTVPPAGPPRPTETLTSNAPAAIATAPAPRATEPAPGGGRVGRLALALAPIAILALGGLAFETWRAKSQAAGSADKRKATPPATTCSLTRQLQTWSIADGDIDLSASASQVLVAADTPIAAPRFAFAANAADHLEEWVDPPMAENMFDPNQQVASCAGITRGEVAGGLLRNQDKGRALFAVLSVTKKLPRSGTLFDGSTWEHHSTRLRCASSAAGIVMVSWGDDAPMPGAPYLISDFMRIVTDTANVRPVTRAISFSHLTEFAVASNGDVLGLAIIRDKELLFGTTPLSVLDPLVSPVGPPGATEPAVAFTGSQAWLVWRPTTKPGIAWASYAGTESRVGEGMLTTDGDVFSPLVAARDKDIVFAYGKRTPAGVAIIAGAGPTLEDAKKRSAVVATGKDISQIRLASSIASGGGTWLAWVEGASGSHAVHVGALGCP